MPGSAGVRRVDFLRRKYGPELLVDAAWLHELPPAVTAREPYALSFYDILLVTRGRGRLWLDARAHRVAPGRVFFTSPGQVRRFEVRGLDGPCLFFPREFLAEFFADPFFLHRLRFFHRPRAAPVLPLGKSRARALRGRLDAMASELRGLRADSAHLLRARVYETLVLLDRWYAEAHTLTPGQPGATTIRFLELIERHFTGRHQPAYYARQLGMSLGHLTALSKRELGQTAGQAIRNRLVIEAKRALLHGDETVAAIALRLGFDDPAYFSRFFRRETGQPPLALRAASVAGGVS